MNLKFVGAIFIVGSCGGYGMKYAMELKKEQNYLQQLIRILDFIICELQYRLLPLPELFRLAAGASSGILRKIMAAMASEMEHQISPDAASCMQAVLSENKELPLKIRAILKTLGKSMGLFDLSGQLKDLEAIKADCCRELSILEKKRENHLRDYQTLSLCAGAALVILFL